MKNILITGGAGFIGYHLTTDLLEKNLNIISIDNLNSYYSVKLKEKRLEYLKKYKNFNFIRLDFGYRKTLNNSLKDFDFDLIIHLGAQAGVRYSLVNPWNYIHSNERGTLNIFEFARKKDVKKVIFSSSSSVYGGNEKMPFSEKDRVDKPISLYASTKRSNELMAHAYHYLYDIEMMGLRFFTVYGEFGRPDMAYFKFARDILLGKKIEVYGNGKLKRDFTYISDIINGINRTIESKLKFEIINLGNSRPIELDYFIALLEKYLEKKAKKSYIPKPKADVVITYADILKAERLLGWKPKIKIEEGLKKFCSWFLSNWDWIQSM